VSKPPVIREPTKRLSRWYAIYSVTAGTILVIVVGWLGYWMIDELHRDAISNAEMSLNRRATMLELQLKLNSGHLERIRGIVENLQRGAAVPSEPPWTQFADSPDGRYVYLAGAPDAPPPDGTYFQVGSLDTLRTDPMVRHRIGLSTYLLGVLDIEFTIHPGLVTTWYRHFGESLTVYPRVSAADFRAAYSDVDIAEHLTLDQLEMPFWRGLRADFNPQGRPFWTAPYMDLLGKGMTVTYAAPIREAGEVIGMVGTDVALSRLEGLLRHPGHPGGAFILLGDDARVLLAPQSEPLTITAGTTVDTLLPPRERDARYERRVPVEGTPWTLVWATNRWDLFATLLPESFLPFLLLVLIGALMMLGHMTIRRRFVQPTIALVRHLEAEARGEHPATPAVSEDWRRWFESVTDTFKLRQIAENLPVVVARLRFDGEGITEILFGEEEILTTLGEPPGSKLDIEELLSHVHEEDLTSALAGAREAVETGRIVRRDLRFQRIAGRVRWIRVFSTSRTNEPDVLDCMAMDVTAEIETENLRRRYEVRMQQAQKAESLGILAGGVAHDFNNILMGMIGHAELAEMELTEDSPTRKFLREIIKGGRRASELAHQMLAYAGRGRLTLENLSLDVLVDDLRGLIEASITKKVDLYVDQTRDLPIIEGDSTQLRQVIMNLVINAAEAIGEAGGTVTISTSEQELRHRDLVDADLSDDLAPGRYVSLNVRDTGKGMDEETRRRIFDPFFSTKTLGRGLGLASVLGIVRGHGGAIGVASEPDRGATFRVLFPVHGDGDEARTMTPPLIHIVPREFRGITMIADDEPAIRKVMEMMLRRLGFEVLAAEDGVQALDLLSSVEEAPSLVFLDYSMPRMDGPSTLAAIQAAWPGLPVVLCSGYDAEELAGKMTADATAYLQKPIRYSDLARVLEMILDDRDPPSGGVAPGETTQ